MIWNVQGLDKKLYQRDFIDFCTNNDILSCSEIHNCTKEKIMKYFNNYDVYVSHRIGYSGGGVAVCVRKALSNIVTFVNTETSECILLHVKKSYLNIEKDLIICFPYIPHYYSMVFEKTVTKGIDRLMNLYNKVNSKYKDVHWLIGGDFNARTGKLDDYLRLTNLHKYIQDYENMDQPDEQIEPRVTRDPSFTNTYGQQLVKFCKGNNLYILNGRTIGDLEGKVTCIANKGKTIVDYFIASRPISYLFEFMTVTPRHESDHFPLTLSVKTEMNNKDVSNGNNEVNCHSITKLVWQNNKIYEYVTRLNQFLTESNDSFNNLINEKKVTDASSLLEGCIIKASKCMHINKSFYHTTSKQVQPQWWDEECNYLKGNKYRFLNKFHSTNKTQDLYEYLDAKKIFKNLCAKKQKEYDIRIIDDLVIKADSRNSREFWSLFNKLMNGSRQRQIEANVTPTQWYNYFNQILNVHTINNDYYTEDVILSRGQCGSMELSVEIGDNLINDVISMNEVRSAVYRLRCGKACGMDGIVSEFYNVNCDVLVNYLCNLFNCIFQGGKYPTAWCQSLIQPLHKKGSMSEVNNYRGISLLNVVSKIFTSVLHERLREWADLGGHIPESQAGARKGYCTIDNIFCMHALASKYISKTKGRFYILFIDFSKAYDNVDRGKLWQLLQEKGLNGEMLNTLKNIYSKVLASVKVDKNHSTDYFNCYNGLKQGCNLSTILFSFYISKLEEIMRQKGCPGIDTMQEVEILMLMYIDDLCIFSDNVIDLQRKINVLSSYCNEYGLEINLTKSKVMVIRNGGVVKKSEKWYYNGTLIDVVSYYSYLGVIVSSRLMWSKHIDNMSSKAHQIISRIVYMCNHFDHVPMKMLFKIFDGKIKPILLYGSEIWGVRKYEDIEKVHLRFCKVVLGVGKTTWNFAAIGECGRYPLYVEYHVRAIKYWCKLVTTEESRYNSKCYKLLYKLDAAGRKNWASDMRSLLCCLGYGIAWYSQTIGDIKAFICEIRERLLSISCQEWYGRVDHLCPEYLCYQPSPFAVSYTRIINSYHRRRLFALLRTKGLPIKNNLLRLNIVYNNLCEKCNGIYVENEYHILFRCTKYKNEREKYLPTSLTTNPSIEKLNNVLISEDATLVKNIIDYLQEIMKNREYTKDN